MAKEKISRNEYLQLVGLFTLAKVHATTLWNIEGAAMAIVGESERYGAIGEAVWDMNGVEISDLNDVLESMKIEVEPEVQS